MKLHEQAVSVASDAETAREAVLVLEDGTAFRGKGLGAFGQTLGEVSVALGPARSRGLPHSSGRLTRSQNRRNLHDRPVPSTQIVLHGG